MPPLHTMYCFDDCISASCTEGQRIMSPNAEDVWCLFWHVGPPSLLGCYLQLWVDVKTADQFQAIKKDLELGQVCCWTLSQSRIWSTDEFSPFPWVAFKVASEIGTKHEGPCAEVIRTIEAQWEQIIGYTPHHIQENINEMKLPGFPHSVTVRHRKSRGPNLKSKKNTREISSGCMRTGSKCKRWNIDSDRTWIVSTCWRLGRGG